MISFFECAINQPFGLVDPVKSCLNLKSATILGAPCTMATEGNPHFEFCGRTLIF